VRGAYLKFGPKFQYIKRKVEENFLVGHDEWAYLHSTYRCGHWRRFVLIIRSDVRFEIWCSDGHRLGQAYYKIHCDLGLWSLPISFTPNSPLVFVSLRNVIPAPSCTLQILISCTPSLLEMQCCWSPFVFVSLRNVIPAPSCTLLKFRILISCTPSLLEMQCCWSPFVFHSIHNVSISHYI
jgi:hypothetical protein